MTCTPDFDLITKTPESEKLNEGKEALKQKILLPYFPGATEHSGQLKRLQKESSIVTCLLFKSFINLTFIWSCYRFIYIKGKLIYVNLIVYIKIKRSIKDTFKIK